MAPQGASSKHNIYYQTLAIRTEQNRPVDELCARAASESCRSRQERPACTARPDRQCHAIVETLAACGPRLTATSSANPSALSAGARSLHVCPGRPADARTGRASARQRRPDRHRRVPAADAPAAGPRDHAAHGLSGRTPDGLRPPVRRPRNRRPAGVWRQPAAAVEADPVPGARCRRPDAVRDDRPAARQQSEVPGDHGPVPPPDRRVGHQAADVLRGVPDQSPDRAGTPVRGAAGTACSWPIPASPARSRSPRPSTAGWSSTRNTSSSTSCWTTSPITCRATSPGVYTVGEAKANTLQVDPASVFGEGTLSVSRGLAEKTIAELRRDWDQKVNVLHQSPHGEIMFIHQKFSFPAACFVFALLAVALGFHTRKEGKLGGLTLGLGVIFLYYALMEFADSGAKSATHWFSPHWARWFPNLVLGVVGIAAVSWRMRATGHSLSFRLPGWRSLRAGKPADPAGGSVPTATARTGPSRTVVRDPDPASVTAPPAPARSVRRPPVHPIDRPGVPRADGALLHRHHRRLVREAVQGPGERLAARAVSVVLDTAFRLFHGADRDARRGARARSAD